MYYHDRKLQFPVAVNEPSPLFAKMLQQALGGMEGEVRVVLTYMLQAANSRGPAKVRDLLLETATEDLGHAEMLATAIALNLEGAPASVQEAAVDDNPMVAAVMGGMSPRHYLSGGMGAACHDSEGNPFDGSSVISSGNLAADLFANVTNEMANACLSARLHQMTDDPGMKRMLEYLIARDNMHAQQWLALLEEMGGYTQVLPIPNSFPHETGELGEFSHTFLSTAIGGIASPQGRWTHGSSLDGKAEYDSRVLQPMGAEPSLGPPIPQAYAQVEEMTGANRRIAAHGAQSSGLGKQVLAGVKAAADTITGKGHDHR